MGTQLYFYLYVYLYPCVARAATMFTAEKDGAQIQHIQAFLKVKFVSAFTLDSIDIWEYST